MTSGQGDDLALPLGAIRDWIAWYDEWYKTALSIYEGRWLHLLYNREIAFVGPGILGAAKALRDTAAVALARGIGVSVAVDLAEAIEDVDRFLGLIEGPEFNHVGLRVLDIDLERASQYREFIERVIENPNVRVGIIGAAEAVREMGLLDSAVYNRADITLYPTGSLTAEALPQPESPVRPCALRFRLHIGDDGAIYPCLGLMDLPGAALGFVGSVSEGLALLGEPYPLNLAALAEQGPKLAATPPFERWLGLPPTCEQHRRELSQTSQPQASPD